MSEKINPLSEIGGTVTNFITYAIIQTAVNAPAANRTVDPAVVSNIVAESVNRNLSTVE